MCQHFIYEVVCLYLQLHLPWFPLPATDYTPKLLHENSRKNYYMLSVTHNPVWDRMPHGCTLLYLGHESFFLSWPWCVCFLPIYLSTHANHQTAVTGPQGLSVRCGTILSHRHSLNTLCQSESDIIWFFLLRANYFSSYDRYIPTYLVTEARYNMESLLKY